MGVRMDKQEELQQWKERLVELIPEVLKQITWINDGAVQATIKADCSKGLKSVAEELITIQNNLGEYQRAQISKQSIEKIKYYAKKAGCSFDEIIAQTVDNGRYLSKDAIEARGVMGYVLEIQRVYNEYYQKYNVFPINAMDWKVKRACRNFKTDVTLTDKVQAIIEVFLPEYKGINIVEKDYSIEPQSKRELTQEEIEQLIKYVMTFAEDGKIDKIFAEENEQDFTKMCRLLAKANMSLDEFLKNYTNLTYSKCYSVRVVPAVKQMILAYKYRNSTTKGITDRDSYLRNKIEVAQKITEQYTMRDLVKFLNIDGDNVLEGGQSLTMRELELRTKKFVAQLEKLYPDHVIDKSFIARYPELYESLKLLSSRLNQGDMNKFLAQYGFTRESSHEREIDERFYLSKNDLTYYRFNNLTEVELEECDFKELNPVDYYGVYSKLIFNKQDGLGSRGAKKITQDTISNG